MFCFVLFPPPLCSLCSQPCMRLGTGAPGHPQGCWAGRDAGEKTLCHRMGAEQATKQGEDGTACATHTHLRKPPFPNYKGTHATSQAVTFPPSRP